MAIKKRLKTTEEVYGVSPALLKEVSYVGGLLLRLDGVKIKYKQAATEWYSLITTAGVSYAEISEIDGWMAYLSKAEKLTRLQLSEAFNKDISEFTIPTTKQVYGIDPFELMRMSYPEALQRKLEGVREKLKEEHIKCFTMHQTKVPYEEISKQDTYIAYLEKAKKLTEFQIEELKG